MSRLGNIESKLWYCIQSNSVCSLSLVGILESNIKEETKKHEEK